MRQSQFPLSLVLPGTQPLLYQSCCCLYPPQISEDITVPRRDSNLTAWVNVIYGCNEKCTYCVVPFTRGQEQSRQADDIKREMLALGEAGEERLTSVGSIQSVVKPRGALEWLTGRDPAGCRQGTAELSRQYVGAVRVLLPHSRAGCAVLPVVDRQVTSLPSCYLESLQC